jgi:hypothetical protein
MTSSARQARPGAFGVVAGALGLFLVVFALLAIQLRAARPTTVAAAPAQTAARRVLERRVVIRKVIVSVRPAPEGEDGSRRTVLASAPVVIGAPPATPAPVSVAPAPAAPAPAPAPAAPLVTRTS